MNKRSLLVAPRCQCCGAKVVVIDNVEYIKHVCDACLYERILNVAKPT